MTLHAKSLRDGESSVKVNKASCLLQLQGARLVHVGLDFVGGGKAINNKLRKDSRRRKKTTEICILLISNELKRFIAVSKEV